MSMYTEADAKAILDKVIALAKGDECIATLAGNRQGNIRFARNSVSTSGVVNEVNLTVQVAFGKRSGIATTNSFDDASLERVVRRAEELAQLAPENPEFVPAVDKQTYTATPTFVQATADIDPAFRAKVAGDSIKPCREDNLVAAGYLADETGFMATANSRGNFGYQQLNSLDYTCTVRTADETGSGWVARNLADASKFDASAEIKTAIRKAKGSQDAKALEPGKYTVVLEPAAVSGLLMFMLFGFDARQADEGRSFLSKKGGGNRIGEKVFDERINAFADPSHPDVPVLPWDMEGMARAKHPIIENGVVKHLNYSRFWAQKNELTPIAMPGNIIMSGGDKTTDEMVASTKRGILVTRTWYIRMVDPQTVLLTGLTRDGTFYIEDGEIRHPIKNFRFNESPIIMLNNIEELGKTERINGGAGVGGGPGLSMMVPAMKVRDFTFTSLSDAV
ncbi:TldD/PmbA family protein [Aquimonas sp.]|uniref:TldD/PmbA family protein n=1 Tax=Aquimonas sp. TaxID=1872588 RepID=UPI0037BF915A